MTFFYDLNKRLADLATKQDAEQITESVKAQAPKSQLAQALDERDLGKHNNATTGFAALAKKTGGGEKGNRIAGAQLAKMRAKGQVEEGDMEEGNAFTGALAKTPKGGKFKVGGKEFTDTSNLEEGTCPTCDCSPCKCDSVEESAFQGYLGKIKYGPKGMKALQKAGREHASEKKKQNIRAKFSKKEEPMDEAEMEEGNAFTAALKSTPKGGKFKVGGKEFTDTSDLEEGFKEMDAWMASREKEKGTGKFDRKERTLPSGMKATTYTRKHEDDEDDNDDSKSNQAEKYASPKKKGRPKSAAPKDAERVTKGSHKYKTVDGKRVKKDKVKEDGMPITDRGEYDQEGESAKHDIKTIVRHAQALHKILGDDDNLPEWVQSKLAKIEGMMIAVDEYMQNQEQEVSEEGLEKHSTSALKSAAGKNRTADQTSGVPATFSTAQLKAELAKRTKGKVQEAGNKAEPMKKAANDKKEEKVDETTVAGSVATAPAGKKSSGGMQFGKGVYEGFNSKVENMITEGMSINISVDEQGKKSISVNATEQDAEALAQLLKMAGLGGAGRGESCPTCSQAPCGCEKELDENSPDYPTNTETSDDALQYAGGLNGPKSTGQTTVPVVASQLRRQVSMEESVELERSLFKTWKNYKG